jgi:HK97 family phage portal protein
MTFRSPIVTNRKALSQMQHSLFSRFMGAFFQGSKRDYAKVMADPTGSSVIMAVMLWIVRRWPEAPIFLEDGKDEAVRDHPMLKKLNRPNPNYSGAVLWWGTILSLVWDGNGYMVKVRNRDLSVRELWYVPHFLMEPMVNPGSQGFVDYYQYSPGGVAVQKLDPSDVVHFRYGIDPFNPRKGFSPLKSIARDAATDDEADGFAAAMLHNMGVPGLLFSPEVLSGQVVAGFDVDAAKKYIKQHFSGDNRGEPMVNAGPTKVQQFGFDPKSMDLSTLRGIPEERVCAVTGVKAAVVGFGAGLAQTAVGATMTSLREQSYEDAIIPLQRLIGPELETQLLDDFEPNPDEWTVKFDLSEVRVLQEDEDRLHARMVNDWNGGLISREEGRKELGFETTDADKIRRVPFSVTEVPDGLTLDEIEALNPPPVIPPADSATPEIDPATEKPAVPQKGRKAKGAGRREKAFTAAQFRSAARHQAVYAAELSDGFISIADRVVAAYESDGLASMAPSMRKAQDGASKPIDPSSPEGIALAVEAHRIRMEAEKAGALADELAWKAHYLAVASTTVDNIKAFFGIALDLHDQVQREIISKGGKHIALVGIDQQTQDAIFKALAQGRTGGLGPREIARAIRSNVEGSAMFPGVAKEAYDRAIVRGWSEEKAQAAGDKAARQYRSEVISRTETKYAQNISTIEVGKSSGTFDSMLIFDAQLGPTDEECEARNGQTVSFDEAQAMADSEHPNGTFSCTPTISGGE